MGETARRLLNRGSAATWPPAEGMRERATQRQSNGCGTILETRVAAVFPLLDLFYERCINENGIRR
jgi:hypothetical protein